MRYVSLYFTCIKRSIISRLEYKKDTFVAIFSFLFSNLASILSIYFIVNSIPSLNGWSIYQLGFLYGFSMMPVAIDHLFSDDLWLIAYHKVRNGEMDRYFLRPCPILFQSLAETFQPEGFGELIVGLVMLILCVNTIHLSWNFSMVILMIVATIFGAVIITSLKIILASLAFKFKRSGQLLQIVYNFISYTRYPLKIFPKIIQGLLIFVFPFAVAISFPAEAILFQNTSIWILSLEIIGVASLFLIISIGIWSYFVRKYESTGS